MRGHPGLKVVRNEQVPIAAEGYRHLDRVLELPDITRPVQRLQELLRLGSDSLSRTALGSLTPTEWRVRPALRRDGFCQRPATRAKGHSMLRGRIAACAASPAGRLDVGKANWNYW